MTDPTWPWADLHQSSVWPWLRNVSTSETPAKGEDYLLLTPMLVLLPFKVGALWLLSHGHVTWGVLTLIAAKLTGTAVAAYLFDLVRDQARQLLWFDRFYGRVEWMLSRSHAWLHRQPAYIAVRHTMELLKIRWQITWHQWRSDWMTRPPSVWSRRLRKVQSRWIRSIKKPP